jgi:hypothetical protein
MFDVLVTGDRSFANVSAYVQSEVKVTANVTPTTKPTVPKSQPGISLISKTTGINYTLHNRLRDFLAAGNWEEANQETEEVIEMIRYIRTFYDWNKFPCEDLRIINQLWLHYSNGKFGFSVQKEIYESLGGTRDYDREVWEKFGDRVGWRTERGWSVFWSPWYPIFNLELAPKAHLPVFDKLREWTVLSRAKSCNL